MKRILTEILIVLAFVLALAAGLLASAATMQPVTLWSAPVLGPYDLAVDNWNGTALMIRGDGIRIGSVTQSGSAVGVEFRDAKNVTIDRLDCSMGVRRYGVYLGGSENVDCVIRTFYIECRPYTGPPPLLPQQAKEKSGQHGIRAHVTRGLFLGDYAASYPFPPGHPGFGFAGYVNHTSLYDGSAITLKEGSGAKLVRVKCGDKGISGQFATGPLKSIVGDAAHPEWKNLRASDITIDRCEFNVGKLYFRVGAATMNLVVRDSVIRSADGDCLDIEGARGPRNEWPAPTGRFDRVKFYGKRFCSTASQPNLTGFTFTECTFTPNGGLERKIGRRGEVQP